MGRQDLVALLTHSAQAVFVALVQTNAYKKTAKKISCPALPSQLNKQIVSLAAVFSSEHTMKKFTVCLLAFALIEKVTQQQLCDLFSFFLLGQSSALLSKAFF